MEKMASKKTIVPHSLSDSNDEQEMTPESIDYRLIFNHSQHNLLNWFIDCNFEFLEESFPSKQCRCIIVGIRKQYPHGNPEWIMFMALANLWINMADDGFNRPDTPYDCIIGPLRSRPSLAAGLYPWHSYPHHCRPMMSIPSLRCRCGIWPELRDACMWYHWD